MYILYSGVPHGVDLFYVFGVPLVGHERYKYDEVDQEASRKAMTIFSDFTKGKYVHVHVIKLHKHFGPPFSSFKQ